MRKVHIIATGARTPVGLTAETSAAAVRAGINRVTAHPTLIDRMAEPVRLARDSQLEAEMTGSARLIEMAASAIDEIGGKLKTLGVEARQAPLLLGLAEERPGWTRADAEEVTSSVQSRARTSGFGSIEILLGGHAAGLLTLDAAYHRIQQRRAEMLAIAGVDSYLHPSTLYWLDKNRQLATSYHRGGFLPGEGAGAFVVASEEFVRAHKLESLAEVHGMGVATESCPIKTEKVCVGEGLSESVGKAVKGLRLPEEAISGILGDINGERYRSDEWGFTLLRFPKALANPTGYELPVSCWGDTGAASGPLFVMLAVAAGRRGWAKGTHYLIWNSSEGGARTAAVLRLNRRQEGVAL